MDISTRPRTRSRQRTDSRWLSTDAELMALVRAGDMGAFAELHARHAGVARATAVALGGSKVSADDVVNEAFTKLLEAVERGFGPTEAFRPYLLQCVRSVVYSGGRRSGREELAEDVPEVANQLDAFDLADESSVVASAFAALPDRWQAVLWMLEVEGKSTVEVAEQLRMRPNAVAALAYRAREGLKERYLARHVEVGPAEECKAIAPLLAGHVRASLGAREQLRVDAHLEVCEPCRDAREELAGLDRSLSRMLIPLFPGMGFGGVAFLSGPAKFLARRWKQVAMGTGAAGAAAGITVMTVAAFSGQAQSGPAERIELAGPVETTSTTRARGQAFSGQGQASATTAPQAPAEAITTLSRGDESQEAIDAGAEVVTVVFAPDGSAPVVTVGSRPPSSRRPATTIPTEVLPTVVEPTTTTATPDPEPETSTSTTATTRPTTTTSVVIFPPLPPSSTLPPSNEFEFRIGDPHSEGRVRHLRIDVVGGHGVVSVQYTQWEGVELTQAGGPGWSCAGGRCEGDGAEVKTLTFTVVVPDGEQGRLVLSGKDDDGHSFQHTFFVVGDPVTTTSSTTSTIPEPTTTTTIVEEPTTTTTTTVVPTSSSIIETFDRDHPDDRVPVTRPPLSASRR